MTGEIINLEKRRGKEYLENLAGGSPVTLNIGGETRLGFYKKGPIRLRIQIVGGKRISTGGTTYRFSIKEGDEIKFAEFFPWELEILEVVGEEVHLPPKFSDLGYEGWLSVDPDSYYYQSLNKKFARFGQ